MTLRFYKTLNVPAALLFTFLISAVQLFSSSAASLFAADPVSIGVSLGLTGKYEKMAVSQSRGFRLWETTVNDKGGILGREVQLRIYDDKSDPDAARQLYTKMIEQEKVDFLFGPFSSAITEAVMPVAEQHGYSIIASGASADSLWAKGYRHLFGMFTPASNITVSFLEMLALNHINSIAIVYADDAFSSTLAAGSKKWAERFGLDVVFFEKMGDPENLDALAMKLKQISPEALIAGGLLQDAVAVRTALSVSGWQPKAFYAPQGPGLPAYRKQLGEAADYTFSSSQWELLGGVMHPGASEFIRSYKSTYLENPVYFSATAYAAGQVLEAAVEKAGALDRNRVRDTLSTMSMLNVSGRYRVDARGMQIKHFTMVVQLHGQKRNVVWPPGLAQREPVFQ